MRIALPHAPYIAQKIAIDLNRSEMVKMTKGIDAIVHVAQKLIEEDIKKDYALEAKVNELLQENEEQIEFYLADEKQLFWMMKKKLAPKFGVILGYEERFSDLAHKILDELYEEDLMMYDVAENMIKNVIYDSIDSYIKVRSEIENRVIDRMDHYKRKLIPGTEEYDIVFTKLFEEELRARGMA